MGRLILDTGGKEGEEGWDGGGLERGGDIKEPPPPPPWQYGFGDIRMVTFAFLHKQHPAKTQPHLPSLPSPLPPLQTLVRYTRGPVPQADRYLPILSAGGEGIF
jgi:hypothetical protein